MENDKNPYLSTSCSNNHVRLKHRLPHGTYKDKFRMIVPELCTNNSVRSRKWRKRSRSKKKENWTATTSYSADLSIANTCSNKIMTQHVVFNDSWNWSNEYICQVCTRLIIQKDMNYSLRFFLQIWLISTSQREIAATKEGSKARRFQKNRSTDFVLQEWASFLCTSMQWIRT